MYLDKKNGIFRGVCKKCGCKLEFMIPREVIGNSKEFPVIYRYVHGTPFHSITLFLDKDFNIRGVEFNDSVKIAENIMQSFIQTCKIGGSDEAYLFIRTVLKGFFTVIKLDRPEWNPYLFKIGETVAASFKKEVVGDPPGSVEELFDKLGKFYGKVGMGEIEFYGRDGKSGKYKFGVKDCFECGELPIINKKVCSFDEGFFSYFLSEFYGKEVKAVEIECMANGDPMCMFEYNV